MEREGTPDDPSTAAAAVALRSDSLVTLFHPLR